jgi:hypothetical protein
MPFPRGAAAANDRGGFLAIAAPALWSCKILREQETGIQSSLAATEEVVGPVAEEWQRSLARERLDWLYTYDARTIQLASAVVIPEITVSG